MVKVVGVLIIIGLSIWLGFLWGQQSEQRKRMQQVRMVQAIQAPDGGCLRQAFAVGLAYMGRYDDVSWLPVKASLSDIRLACEKFGLTLVDGSGDFRLDNPKSPVLMCYVTDDGLTENGDKIQHCVFASDSRPFERWQISCTVIGWDGNHGYQWIKEE